MFLPTPPAPDPTPQTAQSPIGDSDAALQEMADYVLDCLNHGSEAADIRKSLVAKGLSEPDAKAVVNQMLHVHSGGTLGHDYRSVELVQAMGRRNMAIGGIVCVIGLLVTVGTAAAGSNVVIAWGAILWGGVQFCRGMNQANRVED